MRCRSLVAGMTMLLVLAADAGAQSYPYTAKITSAEAVVRSGPSYQFYATSRLAAGTQVTVLGIAPDNPSWLQIQPPPGSFSWIDTAALSDDQLMVQHDEAPVYVGSQVYDAPPNVSQLKAHKGEQVIPAPRQGTPMTFGRERLIMIAPLPREVRYIPASTLAQTRPQVAVQTTPIQPAAPANVALQAAQVAAAPTYTDRLWEEAERADARQDSTTAIPIYDRLSREEPNEARRVEAANRADWLRRGWHGSFGSSVAQSAATAPAGNPNPKPASLTSTPSANTNAYANRQTGLQYTWAQDNRRPPVTAPIQATTRASSPAAATPIADGRPQWSPPGQLRPAPLRLAGRPVYALENSQGEVLLYATAEPGINLDSWLYRGVVYLGGPLTYDGTLRKNTMRVTAVQPPRQ